MATYLQGVTDYIPQFQPFQPDLNFYANALQTKQTQYDSNYKALNNVYGQYFYADLTHGDNIKKKDELIKAIDFNLKRVSGLDLSLDQNVEQAKQVFKPFYEDKTLMKDMAWTKNTNSQRTYAAGLKNARDEKLRAQYWEAGIRAIDYKTEEFKNASLDETMGIGNVNYTPYVNVMEKAQKIAKDAGLSVETVDMSPDGKWIVKTKNGEQLIPQLSHLFEATLGSDPAVMDVYTTQAYVNRKDYAYSNAAQFGGDQNAAEMKYLSESYNMLKAENDARKIELEKNSKVYDKKAGEVERAIENNSATPDSASYLERLNQARNVNSTLLSSTDNHVNSLSTQTGTATTSTGFENPYGDIESLRYKVDNAMAAKLMQKDLGEAANVFAYKDAKQYIDANPYAVQAEAHKYRMQEVASANASRERAARMRNATEMGKSLVATGAYDWDQNPNSPTYGQAIPKEEADTYITEKTAQGASTDVVNLKDASALQSNRFIDTKVLPYLKNMLVSMEDLKGNLSPADMQTIFGDKNMTIDKFNAQLNVDPYNFIKGTLGTTKLKRITNGFQKVIKDNYNSGITVFKDAGDKMSRYTTSLNDYYAYTTDLEKWKTESRNVVIQNLNPALKPYGKFMFDDKGNLRSKEEFHRLSKTLDVGDKSTGVVSPGTSNLSLSSESLGLEEYSDNKKRVSYDALKKAIHEGYSTAPIKKAPPGFASIGELKNDTGLSTVNRQVVSVYPNAYNTLGAANWNEFKKDINNLDFGAQVEVNFLGPVKFSPNRNKEGKTLIDAMFNETAKNNSALKGFRLAAQPIAHNKAGKGAMIVYPDAAWLKEHTYTTDSDGKKKGVGIISEDQANYILENGISFVSDTKNWNNGLFQSTYTTPFEATVNYNESVKVDDPNDASGANFITFSKDDVMGGYKYDFGYKVWDPASGKYVPTVRTGRGITSGVELEQKREQAFNYWPQVDEMNNENFRSR